MSKVVILDNLGAPLIPTPDVNIWIGNLGSSIDIRLGIGSFGAPLNILHMMDLEEIKMNLRQIKLNELFL